MMGSAKRTVTACREAVPNRRRALIVSANDALREKLIDEAVGLHLSVKAIRLSDELPDMLRIYKFDWVILDLEADEAARLTITRTLSRQSAQAGIVLVSQDEIVLASARAVSAANGLKVVGVLSRAFSPTALGTALGRRARGRAGRASSRPEAIFGRRKSIPADQIVIHYQPVIGIEDRRIRSVEALALQKLQDLVGPLQGGEEQRRDVDRHGKRHAARFPGDLLADDLL